MKKRFLEAGEFVTTHGVAGELRLYPWCDSPQFLADCEVLYLGADGEYPLRVVSVRPHKNLCVVRLDGVESIEQARPFIGKTVYIDRGDAQLPQGHYFVQDLLGARVVDADNGREYGRVQEVTHPGRHDVWRVGGEDGEYLFPAVPPFLVSLDLEEEVARVRPIEGMFEPPEEQPQKPRRTKRAKPNQKTGKGKQT